MLELYSDLAGGEFAPDLAEHAYLFFAGGLRQYRAKIAAEQAARDDAKCVSYGATRGDPAYVQCRAQLDAARNSADATAAAAPVVIQPPVQAPSPVLLPPPIFQR